MLCILRLIRLHRAGRLAAAVLSRMHRDRRLRHTALHQFDAYPFGLHKCVRTSESFFRNAQWRAVTSLA